MSWAYYELTPMKTADSFLWIFFDPQISNFIWLKLLRSLKYKIFKCVMFVLSISRLRKSWEFHVFLHFTHWCHKSLESFSFWWRMLEERMILPCFNSCKRQKALWTPSLFSSHKAWPVHSPCTAESESAQAVLSDFLFCPGSCILWWCHLRIWNTIGNLSACILLIHFLPESV